MVFDEELYGDFGNDVLYWMCREYPKHDAIDVVHGKVWLIGRAYSVAIERKAGKDFSMKKTMQILIDSKIDEKIRGIAKIERVDSGNISQVLDAHRYLTELIKKATKLDNRSLSSKYLHFHARKAVFIYDSIASANLAKQLREAKAPNRFKIPTNYDSPYTDLAPVCRTPR